MKKLLSFISKKEAMFYVYSILCIIAQVGFVVAIPGKMGDITEMLQRENCNTYAIVAQGGIMIAYSLLSLAATVLASFFVAKAGSSLEQKIRRKVFEKSLSFSLEEVGRFGSPSLISRCTSDITQVQTFFTGGIQISVESIITIVWSVICITGTNRVWSLATLITVILIGTMLSVITVITWPAVKKIQPANDQLIKVSREHITGIHVIHAYDAFRFQKERYEDINEEQAGILLFYDKARAGFDPGARALIYLLSVVVYVSGAYIISSAGDTEKLILFSDMVEFISYSGLLVSSLIYLIMIISTIPGSMVSATRIRQVLETEISVKECEEETPPDDEKRGEIEFSHVSFRYPGIKDYVLSDISFKVSKGETVAIIGATGCGKTSLLNLIPRLYDTTEGEVYVGGVNVKEYKVKNLRNILGYVPQDSFLFSGSIADNISFGGKVRSNVTPDKIREAAEIGQAAEFIEKREKAYDSEVTHGGSNLSGGQRQRLSIARAVCTNPEIYLFDDSFSALDYLTDSVLRKKLRENAGEATMLIAAQRISTIWNADRIIVMDKGKIVGEGKHDLLMKSCRIYREIAFSQNVEDVDND